MIKTFKNKLRIRYLAVLAVMLIAAMLLPTAFVRPSQGVTSSIVTGIGIDKQNGEYTVSVQTVASNPAQGEEVINTVDTTGTSIISALQSLSFKLGKNLGFEHLGVIVLGNSMQNEEIVSFLIYLYRHRKISLNTVLINYQGPASDLLSASNEVYTLQSGSLQNNSHFGTRHSKTARSTTVGMFLNDFYKKGSPGIIPEIEEPEKPPEGEEGEEGGIAMIINTGRAAIYKNGRHITSSPPEITRGFNRLDRKQKRSIEEIENLNSGPFENDAKLILEIKKTRIRKSRSIVDGKFITRVRLNVYCRPISVSQQNRQIQINQNLQNYLTEEVKEKLSAKIKDEVAASLAFSKTNNVDIFFLEDNFYRRKNRAYKRTSTNITSDDFLQNSEIDLKVRVLPFR